ncbi:MAG: hypothetical protein P8L73_01430 [SAR86 cluster bacterium]|jgi:hypothetical protein|nr:hypothetical protein [Gammaproteobacteria bacterium]MDG0966355.1 hypothetical protein [SAR86 cluster bacterium]MDG2346819.1 hypothetical protein [SAR86 cluster bacterium]|tara:strand:+ start:263 stop:514 length:252 start_codon:yes stop_codon:yes gene_type:complete
MATKDTFEAFVSIVRDKIDDFSKDSAQPNINIVRDELKEKFDELVKSQGYVSSDEYKVLESLAKKLEARVSKLEGLVKQSDAK